MKKLLTLLSIGLLSVGLIGCQQAGTADSKAEKKTEKIMQEIDRQVGMPNIDDFYEKKLAKEIFELRDNAELVTYAYTMNMDGQYIYLGEAIGFGLPYSVQYTNPERIADSYSQGGFAILPQADPNGLFMPEGLSATWLMLVNEETGEPEVTYVESEITVKQSKMQKRLVADWSLPADY